MRRKNNILTTVLSALMVLTLTACLQINELERNPDGAITFRVVSKKSTKGAADREEQTTNNLDAVDIQAWRTTDGAANESIFMKGTLSGGNTTGWEFSDGLIFWPRENLNFFATAPQGKYGGTVSADGLTITDQVITGNTDMVYAMNCNETRDAHVFTPVALNFRHALSQIVFRVSNTNDRLNVIVKGIRIVGINNKGTLKIGHTTTDNVSKGYGTWSNIEASKPIEEISYEAFFALPYGSGLWGAGELMGTTLGGYTGWDKQAETAPLFLLPQVLPTWTVTRNPDNTVSYSGSARIEVLCMIQQNRTDDREHAIWNDIWPRPSYPEDKKIEGCAWIAIPLTNPTNIVDEIYTELGWKSNTKYVYSLVFGEGAGYDPEGEDNALIPVKFNISVEDFNSWEVIDVGTIPK